MASDGWVKTSRSIGADLELGPRPDSVGVKTLSAYPLSEGRPDHDKSAAGIGPYLRVELAARGNGIDDEFAADSSPRFVVSLSEDPVFASILAIVGPHHDE